MSESTQENLFQAMDRFCRLAKALPETQMSLIRFRQMNSYQVLVGKEPVVITRQRKSVGGQTVIRANWTELVVLMSGVMKQVIQLEENATDT